MLVNSIRNTRIPFHITMIGDTYIELTFSNPVFLPQIVTIDPAIGIYTEDNVIIIIYLK